MARTINDIKEVMIDAYKANTTVRAKYDVAEGDELILSKVSIENIIFYIVAVAIWTMEVLFDKHKEEVKAYIDEMKPHSLRWYVNKAKAYRHGYSLVDGTDSYSEELTEEQLEVCQVVKNAATVEKNAIVYIKVASAAPAPLTSEQLEGLEAYLAEVKDAGVVLRVRNEDADHYRATINIRYNPMVINSSGGGIVTGGEPVREKVISFLASLPFNGEYRNDKLIDAIQAIDGVVMANMETAQIKTADGTEWTTVVDYAVPYSGYYTIAQENDLIINYSAYESVSN
ncbi:MAG TPA: hypothetical protein PLN63_05300 [Paludibacteraceae bacterium]|nr:hypothetical protein [Paludibacteraceae bacterium]HOU68017.1 hypothetical protein [Paludibacteraceae bacterium]HPH63016.1 hypothetical protein [Paludibacteraceae bacterium]HQF49942.1 hypothetical protein [Paludibacteraceae bacterium]